MENFLTTKNKFLITLAWVISFYLTKENFLAATALTPFVSLYTVLYLGDITTPKNLPQIFKFIEGALSTTIFFSVAGLLGASGLTKYQWLVVAAIAAVASLTLYYLNTIAAWFGIEREARHGSWRYRINTQ